MMIEYDNVKEALEALIELVDTAVNESEGEAKTAFDFVQERTYNIADLLGMEDLYLKDIQTRRDHL